MQSLEKHVFFFFPHLVLNSFHMPAAQTLDLTAQLEVAPYLGVIQNTETINDRHRPTRLVHHLLCTEIQVGFVPHSKNDCINSTQDLS